MNKVYLLTGSNEGNRMHWLSKAAQAISSFASISQMSSIYETAAWGLENQPDFLNRVLAIVTPLNAEGLLRHIQKIESDLGRQRSVKWGQRTLDIDILFYNAEIIDTENLKVPHPFLQNRRFTLAPLNEIAGDFIHPVLRKTIGKLLEECDDPLPARKM